MPVTTPDIKVDAVRRLGGTVELVGETYSETQTYAQVRILHQPGYWLQLVLVLPRFSAQCPSGKTRQQACLICHSCLLGCEQCTMQRPA